MTTVSQSVTDPHAHGGGAGICHLLGVQLTAASARHGQVLNAMLLSRIVQPAGALLELAAIATFPLALARLLAARARRAGRNDPS